MHQIIELVQEALHDLEDSSVPLDRAVRKAIRVARLRRDFDNLYWLALEVRTAGDQHARKAIFLEVAPHYTQEQFEDLHRRTVEAYLERRRCDRLIDERDPENSPHILGISVGEIEAKIAHLAGLARDLITSPHIESFDYMHMEDQNADTRRQALAAAYDAKVVLGRIRAVAHDFLSRTEAALYTGNRAVDVIERNRKYVEDRLAEVAPAIREQFQSAFDRLGEDDLEARSHALTSCRRILKAMADILYPPPKGSVVGRDGKERDLTDAMFVARLWQFIHEGVQGTSARELLEGRVQELGSRVERLNELASKGVHAEVSRFEVEQCVMQTYMLVGDLLRIHEGQSAVDADMPSDPT